MLEFNQSNGGCGGGGGSFDSPGPSLVVLPLFFPVERVQAVITAAKWNHNPENSELLQRERRRSSVFNLHELSPAPAGHMSVQVSAHARPGVAL